jgi:hypothetical protein
LGLLKGLLRLFLGVQLLGKVFSSSWRVPSWLLVAILVAVSLRFRHRLRLLVATVILGERLSCRTGSI